MFLLRWVARWPLWLVQAVGAGLGWLNWLFVADYRRVLAANLAQAGLSKAVGRRAIGHTGRMMLELPWMWFRQPGLLYGSQVQWRGDEHVAQALAAGKGLLLLTPHVGCFELAARAYAERWGAAQPITVLYRPARQAVLAEVQTRSREAPGMHAAPANLGGVRQLLRSLRKGQTLGMLPDQVPPAGQGVWAPFFDKPAYTMTLAGRLAQQTGCAVLLTWSERLPGGRGFVIHYAPLPVAIPAEGDVAAAQAINTAMEWTIRQLPGQYLWGYKRYHEPRSDGPSAPPADAPAGLP
jgi:KDO2-lipid IV(A) lauroyltransferase